MAVLERTWSGWSIVYDLGRENKWANFCVNCSCYCCVWLLLTETLPRRWWVIDLLGPSVNRIVTPHHAFHGMQKATSSSCQARDRKWDVTPLPGTQPSSSRQPQVVQHVPLLNRHPYHHQFLHPGLWQQQQQLLRLQTFIHPTVNWRCYCFA